MAITRSLTVAAMAGATAVLLADVLLQGALTAVRIDAHGWNWLAATLLDRGRWVVVAGLLWLARARAPAGDRDRSLTNAAPMTRSLAFELVGRGMVSLPLLWLSATLLMRAIRITVDGAWPYDGRVFLASDFYAGLIVGYAPWALGGVVLIALSRHVGLTEVGDARTG
jgi:hypothetical protein